MTGSTFSSGQYDIAVTNVQEASSRVIVSDEVFLNAKGEYAQQTDLLRDSTINGVTLRDRDVLRIQGTDPDGTQFTSSYVIDGLTPRTSNNSIVLSSDMEGAKIRTFSDLIYELGQRDRSWEGFGFNHAAATLSDDGRIVLEDDISSSSSTQFTITVSRFDEYSKYPGPVNPVFSNTASTAEKGVTAIRSKIVNEGNRESATISVDGGAATTVKAGQMVKLQGTSSAQNGQTTPEITFRIGSGLVEGRDELYVTEDVYEGALSGGGAVQFHKGEQNVIFTTRSDSGSSTQRLALNFDAYVETTSINGQNVGQIIFSATSRELNFQIGSGKGNSTQFALANLNVDNLGTDAANLGTINVSTVSGAELAMTIVEEALQQMKEAREQIDAIATGMEEAAELIDFSSRSIESAQKRIVDADTAKETAEGTMNSVQMNAQAAILSQANITHEKFYDILLDPMLKQIQEETNPFTPQNNIFAPSEEPSVFSPPYESGMLGQSNKLGIYTPPKTGIFPPAKSRGINPQPHTAGIFDQSSRMGILGSLTEEEPTDFFSLRNKALQNTETNEEEQTK